MIRAYEERDLERLQAIHRRQALHPDFPFPDLTDPQYLVKEVSTDDQTGRVEMAAVVRLTSEAYLLIDPESGERPESRWSRFLALHRKTASTALQSGLQDIHCWVPPGIERQGFGRRLKSLGWEKALWPCYVLELEKTRGKERE